MRRVWADWISALLIVKPATVIAGHRKRFRPFLKLENPTRQRGRPAVPQQIRNLIRMMSRNNPLWGAPRIHGELLKLGIEITESTVAKYMLRGSKPPLQSWRTILENHVKAERGLKLDHSTIAGWELQYTPGKCCSIAEVDKLTRSVLVIWLIYTEESRKQPSLSI